MNKRIFVGGLPYSLTEDELKTVFEEIGSVSSCTLIIDKFTNQSKGFAFVEMEKGEDADKAIKTLDGKMVGGRKIVVKEARPREERNDGYGRSNNHDFNRGNQGYQRNNRGSGGFNRH